MTEKEPFNLRFAARRVLQFAGALAIGIGVGIEAWQIASSRPEPTDMLVGALALATGLTMEIVAPLTENPRSSEGLE